MALISISEAVVVYAVVDAVVVVVVVFDVGSIGFGQIIFSGDDDEVLFFSKEHTSIVNLPSNIFSIMIGSFLLARSPESQIIHPVLQRNCIYFVLTGKYIKSKNSFFFPYDK